MGAPRTLRTSEHGEKSWLNVDLTTRDVGSGRGQGLAQTRAIVVDRHHGSISFTSEPGHGTTFAVRLPIDGSEQRDSVLAA